MASPSVIPNNGRYEVLTPRGWSTFDGVSITERNLSLRVRTTRGDIVVTPEHKLQLESGEFIAASDIIVGLTVLSHSEQPALVVDVQVIEEADTFYDLLNVEKGNRYFTNKFVSHNCRFEGSANSLIPGHIIEQLVADDPISKSSDTKVYEEYQPGRMYGMFVDVGQGVGGDYSVVQVFDITSLPFRQVAIYRNNTISPMMFPEVIYRMSQAYRDPIIVVERNDQGARVAESLFYDYELENVMQTVTNGRTGQVLVMGEAAGRFGVQMTKAVKKIGCSHFKTLMENHQLIIRDEDTIREISTFVKKGDSYAAEELQHDDCVMPLVLLSWCSNQAIFRELTSTDARSYLLKVHAENIENSMLPLGFNVDDLEELSTPTYTPDWYALDSTRGW